MSKEIKQYLAGMVLGLAWFAVSLFVTGCGPLLGIKEITTSGGTNVKFITGADFHIGANGIDTVEDRKGISPGVGFKQISKTN